MEVSLNKSDIINVLSLLKINSPIIKQNFNIDNNILISKNLPVGSLELVVNVSAYEYSLVLNIIKATILGGSVFGGVRKVAGDFIISTLKPYKNILKAVKNKDGNIQLNFENIQFINFEIKNDTINFSMNLNMH
jgi:hypothetical protein